MTKAYSRLLNIACLFLAGLVIAAPVSTSVAANENQAVLVLDHSSSMWSQIEGEAKIGILRNTIGAILPEIAGKLDLGMIAYGTQKSRGCETTDLLKPLGPIDPARDAKALNSANPKGSAPVAATLSAASKLFKTQTGARSIILVTDSVDDCKADPCAVAEALKSQSPQTVVHVVAFNEKSTDTLQDLACISEQTGGVFQTAQTSGELNEAVRKMLDLAEAGLTEDPDGRSMPITASALAPPGPELFSSDEPGTLVLSAVLAKETPALRSGLVWRIYSGELQQDGNYRLLHRFQDARTTVTLKPGDYLVNAAYGQANLTKRVTVWPEKRQEDVFNLNAGGLRLYATLAKQPLFSEQALTFDVLSEESDQFGNRRKVISGAKPGVVLRLNSGNYRVESTYGDANAIMEVDVKVEPGKLTEASIDHQAGKVTFRLVEKPGGEAMSDAIWQIFASDGQLVKRSGGAFPSHVLAAGGYTVRVEHSGQEFAARFSVDAGDKKQVEVVMP